MIVVLSGPESVGKTSLCQALANCYQGQWLPEYARTYLESLPRHYQYSDVEHIAQVQYQTFMKYQRLGESQFVFFDTYLIITKIWFFLVYGRMPEWLDQAIRSSRIDLVLLLSPDLPWEEDPLRENGDNEKREFLFRLYKKELDYYSIPYYIVSGTGDGRLECCRKGIQMLQIQNKKQTL